MKKLVLLAASMLPVWGWAVSDAEANGSTEMNRTANAPTVRSGDGGGVRVLFIGNSITLHAPAPQIGWTNDWGMAASALGRDYVHLVTAGIERETGRRADTLVRNLAEFERHFEDYDFSKIDDLVAFRPDYLVVALGENVRNLTNETDRIAYRTAFKKLLSRFTYGRMKPHAVVRGVFWANPMKDSLMAHAASDLAMPFVTAHCTNDALRARGLFAHGGVASHPGDRGMEMIASQVLEGLFPKNSGFAAWVNGRAATVTPIRVSRQPFNQWAPGYQRPADQTEIAGMLRFETEGAAEIRVRPDRPFANVLVRPLSANVKCAVNGGEVRFTLPKPGYYVLELGDHHRPLEIFADLRRDFSAERKAANIVFGPGRHEPVVVKLKSHDRVYIDRDAVVFGSFQADGVEDVKVSGYGVICGERNRRVGDACYRDGMDGAVRIIDSKGVTFDGPTVIDSCCWCVAAFNSSDIVLKNMKVTGAWRYNTDGIDICNSQRVRVENCYVHSFDDTLVVKGISHYYVASKGVLSLNFTPEETVEDIRFSKCVCWCGWGRTLEIGLETWASAMRGIVFEDCDLIHNASAALSVHLGGPAVVDDVTYRDIRVECDGLEEREVLQRSRDQRVDCPIGRRLKWLCVTNSKMFTPGGMYASANLKKLAAEPCGSIRKLNVSDIRIYRTNGAPDPSKVIAPQPGTSFGEITVTNVVDVTAGLERKVTAEVGSMTLPTYPYSDPDPVATADPGLYPYFRHDGQSASSHPQTWQTVVLSNGRIEVIMVPAIGGKVWRARDLVTGRDFIYSNDAVKFRDIALRGPWCSGGIEFNFGITGHAPWTTAPVDWTVRRNSDGSASYFCGGYEFVTRTFWQVEVMLRPNEDFFTTRFTWHNGGGAPCTRYQWSNSAVSARGNPEMVYPGSHQIGHCGTAHPWPRDEQGVDRSRYANDAGLEAVSWHVMNGDNRFFGAWWDGLKFGMWHRNASEDKFGRKIFMWSQARSGGIWEDLLTDRAGQYIELQSGRGMQQQVAGCENTPFKFQTLVPGATDVFEETWGCARNRSAFDEAKEFPCGEIARPTEFPRDYDTNSVYALYRNGEQTMRAGHDVALAAKLLEAALGKDPCFVPVLGELAAFELRRGNSAKAEALAEKALAVDTYDGQANFIAGEIALDANRLVRARERFGVASLDAAYRPAALVRLGMVAIREGGASAGACSVAAACARKALDCSAHDPEAHQLAAVAARLSGRKGAALEAARRGLAVVPIHYGLRYEAGERAETLAKGELPGPTLIETGIWYAKAGLADDAKRIWSAAKNPIATTLAGDLAGAAAQPVELVYPHGRETIAALEKAVKESGSWKFKYYLAVALRPFGETERSRALLESCGDAPDSAVFYIVRASCRTGAEAVADLKRAAAHGDSWRIGPAIVKAYLADEKPEEAIAAAQDYRARYPGMQQLDSAAVDALVAAKRYAEAIDILKCIHVLPSEFNKAIPRQWNLCHRELAKAALERGDSADARRHRDAVLEFPENLGAGRPANPANALKDWPKIDD